MSRRRLLLWSAPVALVLVLAALKLLSLGFYAGRGIDDYADGDFAASDRRFDRLEPVNIVERYKAPFNSADAALRLGRLPEAKAGFERALRRAPAARSCDVRFNLAITIELMGDKKAEENAADAARDHWRQAKKVIADGSCPADGKGGAGDRLATADKRLDEKLKDPESKKEPDKPQGTPSPPPKTEKPSDTKQQEIEKRSREGERRQREGEQWDKRDTSDKDPGRKNW